MAVAYSPHEPVAVKPKNRHKVFLMSAAIIIGIVIAGYAVYRLTSSSKAALLVESDVESIVFVNDERKGKTPYEAEFSTGEISLKLVPESPETPLSPYQTKVKLVSNIKTIVRRNFIGESGDDDGSGEIISFDKVTATETNIALVSIPDGVSIQIDNKPQGVTPLRVDDVSPGNHEITLESRGFKKRTFTVKAVMGYTVTIVSDLEKLNPENQPQTFELKVDSLVESETPGVIILGTPLGFLRVRDKASTLGQEIDRVEPGQEYKLLETDENEEWYRIELSATESGWISKEYASQSAFLDVEN